MAPRYPPHSHLGNKALLPENFRRTIHGPHPKAPPGILNSQDRLLKNIAKQDDNAGGADHQGHEQNRSLNKRRQVRKDPSQALEEGFAGSQQAQDGAKFRRKSRDEKDCAGRGADEHARDVALVGRRQVVRGDYGALEEHCHCVLHVLDD